MAVKILAEMGWFIFAMGICGSTDYTPVCKAVYLSRFDMCIIQTESRYYNMELNLDKCINLTLNRKQSSIKFADGSLVPRKHTATYLGTLLTDNVDLKKRSHESHCRLNPHLQQTQTVLDQSAKLHSMEKSIKLFIQSFGVSFYMGWKLSNLTSQNFID